MARIIGVLDFETDPFLYGRVPKPFACELLLQTGETRVRWSPKCAAEIAADIADLGKVDLYAHNGGKFDFHYLLPFVETGSIKIIRNRIAEMTIGDARLIDSYLLVPVALSAYKKTIIDYSKFEEDVRDEHKAEILKYLHDDCVDLLELITGMHERLGRRLTIGGAAMAAIKKSGIRISRQGAPHDERFRPYYYGGRVEAAKVGHWKHTDLRYADINSAYPHAMTFPHPFGAKYKMSNKLPKKLGAQFITLEAVADGSLPYRDKENLIFPHDGETRIYDVTGWEVAAGLETRTLDIKRVITVATPCDFQDYSDFILPNYKKRCEAEKGTIDNIAYKLLINSGYGKFASNCDEYRDYTIEEIKVCPGEGWDFELDISGTGMALWSKPSARREFGYYDVAVSASITGHVRATMQRAISGVGEFFYCDTDSIIYGGRSNIVYGAGLGEWKDEGKITELAIAAKKLYAAKIGGEWFTAAKGVRLDRTAIIRAATGHAVTWNSPSPSFKMGHANFITRTVKRR